MPIKSEVAQLLTGRWKVEMFQAPCAAPLPFCFGCLCTCCAVYQQREELLELTGEPYVCCAGLCPCGPLGEPQDKSCLICEACCCTGLALSANRYMVQTRFDRENTPCDDFIITATCLCVCFLNVAKCFMDVPDEIDFLADCLIMTVNGCMHAQQHIEIQEIKRTGYRGPPPSIAGMLPPAQQKIMSMSRPGGAGAQPQMMGMAGVQQGPQWQQPPPRMQQPSMQQMGYGQGPPMQMQAPLQVQCGGCGQIFGSPGSGITVACPHCGTHNHIAAAGGMAPGMGGMYGQGQGGMYGPGQGMYGGQQPQSGGNGTMMAAAGLGAGALGGLVLADMMF